MHPGRRRRTQNLPPRPPPPTPPPATNAHTAVAVVQAFRPHLTDTHPPLVPWPQAGRDRALR